MLEIVTPRISTEYFSIASGARLAPTYDDTGMPIPARKRRCLINAGLECPFVAADVRCDPKNKHHLFFDEDLFNGLGEEYVRLRVNPLMIIEIARCRHNSGYEGAQHSQYDATPPPTLWVAKEVNVESFALISMITLLKQIKHQIAPYSLPNGTARNRAKESHTVWEKARRLNQLTLEFDRCARRVDSIQLIPRTIVGRKLEELHAERRRLRLDAFGSSTHILPYPVAAELAA